MTKQEIIVNRAFRLHEVAKDMNNSMLKVKVAQKGIFFLGFLRRQSMLLRDIADLLSSRPKTNLMSVFILFRCLLDDFIVLLQIHDSNFSDEAVISHTAHAFYEKFNLLTKSRDINNKHFDGKEDGLVSDEFLQKEWDEFVGNADNDIYFLDKNAAKPKWKDFINVTSFMMKLDADDETKKAVSKANAHALILWKLLSSYVHFSALTALLEKGTESRDIEIEQLNEVLSYVCKSLMIIRDGLRTLNIQCEIEDKTQVIPEILQPFREA